MIILECTEHPNHDSIADLQSDGSVGLECPGCGAMVYVVPKNFGVPRTHSLCGTTFTVRVTN